LVIHLNQVFVHGELVEGESSGLVTAENIHASHFFNGCHPLGDGSLLRQTVRPNSHGDRQDCWHGNWDTSDEKNQQVINAISVSPLLDGIHHNNLNQHSHGNGADTEVSNGSQHLKEANPESKHESKVVEQITKKH